MSALCCEISGHAGHDLNDPMKTSFCIFAAISTLSHAGITYPATPHGDVVDDYHGIQVADPFRALEDDNSAETKAWVIAQNKTTREYLDSIPQCEGLRRRLTRLWNFERFNTPFEYGGKYFYSYNSGLQNQSVLFVTDAIDQAGRVLLDPNTLSNDGTVSLSETAPSEDGKLLLYGTSTGGSDWQEFRVREIASGKDLEDVIRWVKFSGASWAKDGSGFYYCRYAEPKAGDALKGKNEFQKLYFHKIGTPQSADTLIYERADHADWGFRGFVTDDGRYLIIHVSQGTNPKNRVFYKDLSQPESKVVELISEADADYGFAANEGPVFFFHTNLNAPRYRVIAIDTREPERGKWREVIAQRAEKLESANFTGGKVFCEYLKDARSQVYVFRQEGGNLLPEGELPLPGIGSVGGFSGRAADTHTFFSYTSFTEPGAIYRLDIAKGTSTLWRKPAVDFKSENYETRQVFFSSKDGTRVPMFITHKKGLVLDGSAPAVLYGYGGFNKAMTPAFSVTQAVWLENGGLHIVANLRGGGEYGTEWHLAGTKLKKQNVFDDFIGAAEWLVANKYTSSSKLAIQGGSNGGLLVGACMTQRPGLFGAALPAVGVMDMLRFHKFTIGWAWQSDYGSSEDAAEFKALLAYSPLHNLKPGTRYPATLITTGDHDDRVVPAHSFKFAARLQECQPKDGPPVLIRIETSAGHGAGTALSKVIEKSTDQLGFLMKTFGMELHEGP
jgi:prolyl oligopeptidase